jgi:D-alanine-D-alanine ligase
LKVGIAFDLAPSGPSRTKVDGPDDRFEEFDKPETVNAVAEVLRARGHTVELLGDGLDLIRRVLAEPPDLVWNMAEGVGIGRSREARVPALLEMLNIPYTGSDPLTLAATLDKSVAKRLVAFAGGVSIPDGHAFTEGIIQDQFESLIAPILDRGRVILKPSFEGSSKGIRGRCLAESLNEAWETYSDLARTYAQPILVEEFIAGEEVTVGLVGNEPRGNAIGTMRVVPKAADPLFVYSLEVKRDWERRVDYEAPAKLDPDVSARLIVAADACYDRLGCRDLARIDFRIREGIPYFIEANPLPGLAPVTSDLVILANGYGIPYPALIARIFEAALKRLGMVER